jgi:hypothetical protein
VKSAICSSVIAHPKRKNFLAVHPIAGTEFSGPEAAIPNLFRTKVTIICELEKTDRKITNIAFDIFDKLGMEYKYMSPIEHDRHIAYVSHLSHVSSFMLGKTVLEMEKDEQNIFDMAGSGFESTVRLAKSSPSTWTPIFTENKKNLLSSLNEYIKNLVEFKDWAKGNVVELPALVDHAIYSGNATVTNGNLPASPNAVFEGVRALTGYNVYRDGEQVNEELVMETTYTDVLPQETESYCWEVTAVYSVCGESDPSNEVCLDVFVGLNDLENNVNVYPNPATDFVMVEASSDIRSIEITNYMGQVVSSIKSVEMTQTRINTSDLSAGIYFVEVETAAGIEKVRIIISE